MSGMFSAWTKRSTAWRTAHAVLAVVALVVCLVTPFHSHERNDATCVVCHLATAPVLAPATVPCAAPILITTRYYAPQPSRPDSHDHITAASRGPPALLLG